MEIHEKSQSKMDHLTSKTRLNMTRGSFFDRLLAMQPQPLLLRVTRTSEKDGDLVVSIVMGVPPVIIYFRLGFSMPSSELGDPPFVERPLYGSLEWRLFRLFSGSVGRSGFPWGCGHGAFGWIMHPSLKHIQIELSGTLCDSRMSELIFPGTLSYFDQPNQMVQNAGFGAQWTPWSKIWRTIFGVTRVFCTSVLQQYGHG